MCIGIVSKQRFLRVWIFTGKHNGSGREPRVLVQILQFLTPPVFFTPSVQETQEGKWWVYFFKSVDTPDRCHVPYQPFGFVSVGVLWKKWSFLDRWNPQNWHTFGHPILKKSKKIECSQRGPKCVVTGRGWTHLYSWVEELGFGAMHDVGLRGLKTHRGDTRPPSLSSFYLSQLLLVSRLPPGLTLYLRAQIHMTKLNLKRCHAHWKPGQ